MKNIKQEISFWVQFITFSLLFAISLKMSGTKFDITIDVIKQIPNAISYYLIVYLVFSKWLWRWKLLQGWLVPFPDLEGTWKGTIETTWVDKKTGCCPKPIPCSLVIKQSFDTLSCSLFTQESMSYSNAALMSEIEESGTKKLSFNYTNKPIATVRERSEIHDGAAILTIISKPELSLEGGYWTDRKTTGTIKLKYIKRELDEKYIE